MTTAANGKPASGKLLLASTKLVQDEPLPNSPEAGSLENSSNQNDNDFRLPSMRVDKEPRTAIANRKLANGKLSSPSTKLALQIGQDMRAKKVFTLKTG